jgi:hypothetical protein
MNPATNDQIPTTESYSSGAKSPSPIPACTHTLKAALQPSAAMCEALNHQRKHRHDLDDKSKARLAWLYKAIDRLRPIDKTICLLYLDGLNQHEMAEVLASRRRAAARRRNRGTRFDGKPVVQP